MSVVADHAPMAHWGARRAIVCKAHPVQKETSYCYAVYMVTVVFLEVKQVVGTETLINLRGYPPPRTPGVPCQGGARRRARFILARFKSP